MTVAAIYAPHARDSAISAHSADALCPPHAGLRSHDRALSNLPVPLYVFHRLERVPDPGPPRRIRYRGIMATGGSIDHAEAVSDTGLRNKVLRPFGIGFDLLSKGPDIDAQVLDISVASPNLP